MTDRKGLKAVETSRGGYDPVERGDLTGRAAEIFDDIGPRLHLSGRLTPESVYGFRFWCQTVAVAEAAGAKLQSVEARGARTARERVADPTWRGFRDAALLALKLGQEYGLTPSAASNLKMTRPTDPEVARLLS
jgi:phage terminase small subunit